jgi:hypothetical protein
LQDWKDNYEIAEKASSSGDKSGFSARQKAGTAESPTLSRRTIEVFQRSHIFFYIAKILSILFSKGSPA